MKSTLFFWSANALLQGYALFTFFSFNNIIISILTCALFFRPVKLKDSHWPTNSAQPCNKFYRLPPSSPPLSASLCRCFPRASLTTRCSRLPATRMVPTPPQLRHPARIICLRRHRPHKTKRRMNRYTFLFSHTRTIVQNNQSSLIIFFTKQTKYFQIIHLVNNSSF